jgi:hypothetical protein
MSKKEFIQSVVRIQTELKAPKNQYNSFGKYNYRNCEDILEAVKPLLAEEGLVLTLSDEIVSEGHCNVSTNKNVNENNDDGNLVFIEHGTDSEAETKNYVKVTATLTDGENEISVSAVARESNTKKGMDSAQISGATSSYARKYALNGLFLIDDTKDADATNDHGKSEKKQTSSRKKVEPKKSRTRAKKEEPKEEPEAKEEVKEESTEEAPKKRGRGFRRK